MLLPLGRAVRAFPPPGLEIGDASTHADQQSAKNDQHCRSPVDGEPGHCEECTPKAVTYGRLRAQPSDKSADISSVRAAALEQEKQGLGGPSGQPLNGRGERYWRWLCAMVKVRLVCEKQRLDAQTQIGYP